MQKKISIPLIVLAILGIFVAIVVACSTPCDDLANQICNCQPTADKRANCRRIFLAGNPVNISSERQNVCDQALQTCNCDELDAGNFAACGLANTRDF
jgi:hypothetical protein